jgi:putative addiction module killer protein
MNTILRTEAFDLWLKKLKDPRGKARIIERIRSAERNQFGDCEPVGRGVSEMRIHFGPGYRLYFTRVGDLVYVLLCGGSKHRQQRDVAKAQEIAKLIIEEWKDEQN